MQLEGKLGVAAVTILKWEPFNMCGVKAILDDGETVTVDGYEDSKGGGFVLTYRFGRFQFSDRANAYEAAELLNTAIYLQRESVGQ